MGSDVLIGGGKGRGLGEFGLMIWQSGLMRVTRNHIPSGAQVRILVSSSYILFPTSLFHFHLLLLAALLAVPRRTSSTATIVLETLSGNVVADQSIKALWSLRYNFTGSS